MTASKKLTGIMLCLVTILSGCAAAKIGNEPHYTSERNVWPTGTTASYEIRTDQTMTAKIPQQVAEQRTHSNTFLQVTVTAGAPRAFSISVTDAYQQLDTEAPPSPVAVPQVSDLTGLQGHVTLNEKGRIISSTGLEENEFVKFQGIESFIERYLQPLFPCFPDENIRQGLEWHRQSSYPWRLFGLMLQCELTDSYLCQELRQIEDRSVFQIINSSQGTLTGSGTVQGNEISVNFIITAEGTMQIDHYTGMLVSSETVGRIEGRFITQGIEIPVVTESRITVDKASKMNENPLFPEN